MAFLHTRVDHDLRDHAHPNAIFDPARLHWLDARNEMIIELDPARPVARLTPFYFRHDLVSEEWDPRYEIAIESTDPGSIVAFRVAKDESAVVALVALSTLYLWRLAAPLSPTPLSASHASTHPILGIEWITEDALLSVTREGLEILRISSRSFKLVSRTAYAVDWAIIQPMSLHVISCKGTFLSVHSVAPNLSVQTIARFSVCGSPTAFPPCFGLAFPCPLEPSDVFLCQPYGRPTLLIRLERPHLGQEFLVLTLPELEARLVRIEAPELAALASSPHLQYTLVDHLILIHILDIKLTFMIDVAEEHVELRPVGPPCSVASHSILSPAYSWQSIDSLRFLDHTHALVLSLALDLDAWLLAVLQQAPDAASACLPFLMRRSHSRRSIISLLRELHPHFAASWGAYTVICASMRRFQDVRPPGSGPMRLVLPDVVACETAPLFEPQPHRHLLTGASFGRSSGILSALTQSLWPLRSLADRFSASTSQLAIAVSTDAACGHDTVSSAEPSPIESPRALASDKDSLLDEMPEARGPDGRIALEPELLVEFVFKPLLLQSRTRPQLEHIERIVFAYLQTLDAHGVIRPPAVDEWVLGRLLLPHRQLLLAYQSLKSDVFAPSKSIAFLLLDLDSDPLDNVTKASETNPLLVRRLIMMGVEMLLELGHFQVLIDHYTDKANLFDLNLLLIDLEARCPLSMLSHLDLRPALSVAIRAHYVPIMATVARLFRKLEASPNFLDDASLACWKEVLSLVPPHLMTTK